MRTHTPLVRHILAITSERQGLTERQRDELSRLVLSKLLDPHNPEPDAFAGRSKLQTYLTVLVQKMHQDSNAPPITSPQNTSPLAHAIRETTSSRPARETLILRMWFETGMTTQKIASVMGLDPGDVHAVIAHCTNRVQEWLARAGAPSPSSD